MPLHGTVMEPNKMQICRIIVEITDNAIDNVL